MEQPTASQFTTAPPSSESLDMLEALDRAKTAVRVMTSLPIDAVAKCESQSDGSWHVVIDVVESVARMGDNDLLSSYEVQLSNAGELRHFTRLRRHKREDRE